MHRHVLGVYKNRVTPTFTSWHDWGSPGVRALPFLSLPLILPSYAHLRPPRMSGAHVFSNAHDIVVSGGTFYTADTVSGRARYPQAS